MALPKLNDQPKYELTVPSTGQSVKFRPFLVREEKVLLLAMESTDPSQILSAISDTVMACVDTKIDDTKLTTFDIEYLFLKIRGKSVGERAALMLTCQDSTCKASNEVNINIDDVTIEVVKPKMKIHLTPEIALKMKWPMYKGLASDNNLLTTENKTDQAFGLVIQCIEAIQTEDENFQIKDTPYAEIVEFLDSLTSDQYNLITKFMETIPSLSHDVHFKCTECSKENTMTLEGINDFF